MQRINDLSSQVGTIFHCHDDHILVCSPPDPLPITPETLHSIRDKKERGELLTREEWQMFVHFIQIGSEFVRFASLPQVRLLRAFRAAFETCDHRNSSGKYLPYYLKSLPLQCQPWGWCDTATPDMVREVIVSTFEELPTVSELYPEIADITIGESELPSCSAVEALDRQEPFINQTLAVSSLAMLARLLRYGQISYHGGFYNAETGRMAALAVDPVQFARVLKLKR